MTRPVLAFCLLLLAADNLAADAYRCGRRLVHSGDTVSELRRLCGEPRLKDSGTTVLAIGGKRKSVRVQRWHYRQGRRSLEHRVLIYKGKVVAIEVAGR